MHQLATTSQSYVLQNSIAKVARQVLVSEEAAVFASLVLEISLVFAEHVHANRVVVLLLLLRTPLRYRRKRLHNINPVRSVWPWSSIDGSFYSLTKFLHPTHSVLTTATYNDCVGGEGYAIGRVRPSVNILSFEPTDFWPWFFACAWVMTTARRGWNLKVTSQGQTSMPACVLHTHTNINCGVLWVYWPL